MDERMLVQATRLRKNRKNWKKWQKIVSVMACVVVFVTTYALILPAITMERETFCGYEEHQHEDSCYEDVLICGFPDETESDDTDGEDVSEPEEETLAHEHTDSCYSEVQKLICEKQETQGHVHSAECINVTEQNVCGLEEHAGHTHDKNCIEKSVTENLICGQEESAGHTHGETCIDPETQKVICGQEEHAGHIHDESCIERIETEKIICGQEESEGHVHSGSCIGKVETYICGQEEVQPHVHSEACYQTEKVLICQKMTSENNEDIQEADPESEVTKEPHIHTESCYEKNLVCGKEEHEHSLICYSDKNADVETARDWEGTLPESLTGIYHEDVLAVAESQLGYQESTANYEVSDTDADEIKGYTRYGAWYGSPYGDWCAMFASFCIHYAGVENMPLEAGCQNWIERLSSENVALYYPVSEDVPQPGELIFFDWDQDGDSDHVGIVAQLIEATESETAKIQTIEGNSADCVRYVTYEADDDEILGYAKLPEKQETQYIESTLVAQIYTDETYEISAEDDTVITVSGVLPEDAVIKAYPVIVENENQVLCAYDIAIVQSDGSIYEPEEGEQLNVKIQSSGIQESQLNAEELRAYYIPEEGNPQPIATTVLEDGVSFETDHFSVYAVMAAAETGEEIPTGGAGIYYHSTSYPKYQVSSHRLQVGSMAWWVETFVLVPTEQYGGSTWVPDGTPWTAAGNHNYVVAYCADYNNGASDTGGVVYKNKILLSNSSFDADQQKKLQAIIENAYPFITVAEMQERLTAAGYSGTFGEAEMLSGTQWAIWSITDGKSASRYDNKTPNSDGVLYPLAANGSGSATDVKNIYTFLVNDAQSTDPGALEIKDTQLTKNADGTYTVTATLNRAVAEGENVEATLSDGVSGTSQILTAGTSRFEIVWNQPLPESGQLSLSISGTRPTMNVYYYDDDGSYQNMISGELGTMQEDDTVIVFSSVVNITVNKAWSGVDASAAPEIQVNLLKDGEIFETVTLSSSNNWTYTWQELPGTSNGETIKYTVEEEVPDGYYASITTSSTEEGLTFDLINTVVDQETETSVAVEKIWNDDLDHSADAVIVRLYADGTYTGKQLTLNSENDWKGIFTGLPYYGTDGVTPIEYTVKEVEVDGYSSEVLIKEIEAESTITWTEKTSLSDGTMYHFSSGDWALAVDLSGNLISAPINKNSPYQWWTVSKNSSDWVGASYTLYNEKTGMYLVYSNETFTTSSSSAKIRFSSNKLYYKENIISSSYYIQLTSNSVSTGTGTSFTIYQGTGKTSMPTYAVTVTNTPVPKYELPETGGIGTSMYTTGGAVLLTGSLFGGYLMKRKRERRVK